MKDYLNKIRQPTNLHSASKILYSSLIFLLGVVLGVVSKVLDTTATNYLPFLLETLDLGNFFSRIGVWIFLSTLISIYSKSQLRHILDIYKL